MKKKLIVNPFKGLQYISEGSGVGGKYGINIETLTGPKTLLPGVDPIYQYLDPDDNYEVVTLDTANAKAGDRFFIMHNGAWDDITYVEVKQGATCLDFIYLYAKKEFIFNGSDWVPAMTGAGEENSMAGISIGRKTQAKELGVAIGSNANAVLDGVAIGGGGPDAHDYGVAVGYAAKGYDRGVSIGDNALGYGQGTALGRSSDTNEKLHSIALGYRAKNTRAGELAINVGDEVEDDRRYQYQQAIMGSWIRKTTDATPVIMYIDMIGTSRFTIRAQSALTFKIMVTARDNTSGDCAAYLFDGLIKRDNANNTTLCVCNKTVLHEDVDATDWDCDVAADDTNEALQITVTGDDANTVRWAARLDGVETSFVAA